MQTEMQQSQTTTGLLKKKSDSGTSSTNNKLSTGDILLIIKACRDNNVQEFSFEKLNLKFQSQGPVAAVSLGQDTERSALITPTPISEQDADKVDLMDHNALIEAEETQLMIDDPISFERSQIDRFVERNRNVIQTQ